LALIAKHGGAVSRKNMYTSKALSGGAKEYDYIMQSLEERGEVLVETFEGKWRPHSKITLVNTEG